MDRYAVFGNPISHSKSPNIHASFAEQTDQFIKYEAIEAPLDRFDSELSDFFSSGGQGCNITVPFKEQAYRFAHELTERAELAGAVNTLKLTEDGVVVGDNTDGHGLVQDLLQYTELENKRILLLGAGGAARGVIGPLFDQGIKELVIANRTFSKAETLSVMFSAKGKVTASTFADVDGKFDVIINSTSASLSGECPPINPDLIHRNMITYDMMYGANDTIFNAWAKKQGAKLAIDGLGMLVGQAAESFYVWRNVVPKTDSVLSMLRGSLISA